MSLEKATIEELGSAARVEVDKENTTIIDGSGDAKAIENRVKAIRDQIEEATRIQLLPDFTNLKRVIFLGSRHFPLIRLNITLRSKKLFSIDYTQLLGIFIHLLKSRWRFPNLSS